MKNKFIKYIIVSLLAAVFLVTASSCGKANKHLDGAICGEATPDGTNAFSEMRRVYIEQFVYEYNSNLVVEGATYADYKDEFEKKFTFENDVFTEVKEGTDAYTQAHYLFINYDEANKAKVDAYITANVSNPEQYKELMYLCAYGKKNAEDTTGNENRGYFKMVSDVNLDNEQIKDPTDQKKVLVNSVASRMTSHSKACIVFTDNFVDPTTGVVIGKTTWKQAFDYGFLTGIFVYPMSWLVNLFVVWFGSGGWAQIGGIIVVTILLKLLILALTFKSQSGTQKMQDVQPEILKIQNKYGPKPTPQERQKMSMEIMAVYQKYGVKPLAPFLSLLITFPVFIAMYRAVMYLGILRTGNIAGVILGNNLNTYIIGNFKWFALVIFILMASSQIVSMKLPQILNRKRMTPEAKAQQKQTGMVSNVMMVMILVMGFFMPVTMSIYWIASAIVGAIQSLIMHKLNNKSKTGRFKMKKADEEPITIPQGYKTNVETEKPKKAKKVKLEKQQDIYDFSTTEDKDKGE